jgi:tetratricopeptide (TPR) repeat protein
LRGDGVYYVANCAAGIRAIGLMLPRSLLPESLQSVSTLLVSVHPAAVHAKIVDVPSPAAPLQSARLSFSRGDVDAARQLCRGILTAFPDEAGALHLLGLIAHRDGDLDNAKDLLRRAADSRGASALYLLTYAELFCKSDRKAAIDWARRATDLDASLPLGWGYLGHLLLESRQFEESRRCLRRAIELDPAFWQARTHLAVLLGRMGDTAEANARFEHLLGEQPDNAEIIGSFAAFLAEQGHYADALTQAALAITKQPDKLDHHVRAGEIEILQGRPKLALARLAAVERTWPREANLLTVKAHALRLDDRCDEAVELCRNALAQGAESGDLLRAYGLALELAGEDTEALTVFDRAAKTHPAPALSDKGALLSHLGRLPEACAAFDEALTHEPTWADAWYNKSYAKTFGSEDPDIDRMRRLLDRCSYRDRLQLHFALGKACMDSGDPDRAFMHWHEGNRLKRASIDYDASAAARHIASSVNDMSANEPVDIDAREEMSAARSSDVPVFIVGMPRCGSSLIEQILASHPQVHGAGELVRLRALFEAGETGDRPIADTALERLRRFSPRASRVVDKDLCNFLHLGTIHRIFPNARIIHCRRDPLDTCFSAYTKLFAGDFGFTYEQRELGAYYRHYHALMAHWRSVLPPRIFMEIDYEALVSDSREETCRLLQFLDLPWNEACMRFFETPRIVNTASFAQVRRPIYRSSVGSSHSLRPHLRPLIEALGDLARSDMALRDIAPGDVAPGDSAHGG